VGGIRERGYLSGWEKEGKGGWEGIGNLNQIIKLWIIG
jgi:hypothetical protein